MSLSILNDSARDATERYRARLGSNVAAPAGDPDVEFVLQKVAEMRAAVRAAHGVNIRFVIWVGARNSLNDKAAMNATGLLKGGPMFYWLDSADPNKLKSIVDDMQHRAQEPIGKLLPATLVVGMAGETAREAELNTEKLAFLYDKFGIARSANFVEIEGGTNLYALALAGRDAGQWVAGSVLSEAETAEALKLGAFLRAQTEAGRDKATLFLPRSWFSVAAWTKQRFERSPGIRIVVDERFNGRMYRKPTAAQQDRIFVAVQRKGEPHPEATGITALRGAGYPLAVLTFAATAQLSRYMRFMDCAVEALQSLRVAELEPHPSELYRTLASEVQAVPGWKAMLAAKPETPETLAHALRDGAERRKFSYAEVTFFGDMRYSDEGKLMRKALETGSQRIFRVKLRMPADVNEGPAMSHGDGFSLLIASAEQGRYSTANYDADTHIAQLLATKAGLERRRRTARAILVKDLSTESIAQLEAFFTQTAALLEIQ